MRVICIYLNTTETLKLELNEGRKKGREKNKKEI